VSAQVAATADDGGFIDYGTPYVNVNMWYGPVDFAESQYTNACGPDDGSHYPQTIQSLYGNYLIGLDGQNIADPQSHCDDCARLTANGISIIAHVITYGIENGVDAIDLSPQARSAIGLSNSDWTGTWQFVSCPTKAPIYYEFDGRDWSNTWYFRIWIRNHRLPVMSVESQVGSAGWNAAQQQSDGAWQSVSGIDYSPGFQIRVTAIDGQQIVDTIPALSSVNPAAPVEGQANFQ